MNVEKIVVDAIKLAVNSSEIDLKEELRALGINSIEFINIIVDIENELGITIPDDYLLFPEGETVEKMIENIVKAYMKICDENYFT